MSTSGPTYDELPSVLTLDHINPDNTDQVFQALRYVFNALIGRAEPMELIHPNQYYSQPPIPHPGTRIAPRKANIPIS